MRNAVSFHTHTGRCKHADGAVIDYVRQATESGMKVLGISDHAPFPNGEMGSTRMGWEELREYRSEIAAAQKAFPQIRILAGLEVDYLEPYGGELFRRYKTEFGFDYLIGGVHCVEHCAERWGIDHLQGARIGEYAKKAVKLMRTGEIAYLAHPDICAMTDLEWGAEVEAAFRLILQTAAELRLPLEINDYGLRKPLREYRTGTRRMYPWAPFWKLAEEYPIRAVAGADAHRPCDVASLDHVAAFAAENGIALYNAELAENLLARA